ncbi:MAG: hypothetical protein R3C68_17815 [Myxococcota bacterium]
MELTVAVQGGCSASKNIGVWLLILAFVFYEGGCPVPQKTKCLIFPRELPEGFTVSPQQFIAV